MTTKHKEEKKGNKEEKGNVYHRRERRHGAFDRTMVLPCAVKDEKVHAEFAGSVLTVTLPKTDESNIRKVKVQTKV